MTPANYTRTEERALAAALAGAGEVRCPRCEVPMERRELPPLAGFAYVRRRIWLTCPGCRRSVVLDVQSPSDDPDPDRP